MILSENRKPIFGIMREAGEQKGQPAMPGDSHSRTQPPSALT
jgi:hypothetical protein